MSAAPRAGMFLLSFALAAFAWMTAPAAAAPADRVVTYQVHEDPGASDSPVRLTFTIQIAPALRQGDAIGWRIRSVEIAEHGREGSDDKTWRDATPPVTPDDLWWVNHADPENPSTKEFSDLPQLIGTAEPGTNTSAAVRYSLTSIGEAETATGGQEARATYSLAFESDPETPIVEGDDEPVDVDGSHDD